MRGWRVPVTPAMRAAMVAGAMALATTDARAQLIRGTVLDSTSRLPIPGAVVSVLDSAGHVLARSLADGRGVFSLPLGATAGRVRVVRIGFRPRDIPVPPVSEGIASATVALVAIPTMLEPARVDARQCPKRPDSERALGLWEQARAGLLAAVVASEQHPAAMVRAGYQRLLRDLRSGADVIRQVVTLDSAESTRKSYRAVREATDFVANGFSEDSAGIRWYYAPDAEVLLEAGFANGYCMRLAPRNRARPNQLGLSFVAPDRRRGRVDISGTLWIDTLTRTLRDIEYRYVGTIPNMDRYQPGGTLEFREVPNGTVFISRWDIRSVGVPTENLARTQTAIPLAPGAHASHSGGEVAHARWPDGNRYDARLAAAVINVLTYGDVPAAGYDVALAHTPYEQRLDESGVFAVHDLLPGPYAMVVRDERLTAIEFELATRLQFTARRDSTHVFTVRVPSLEEWIADRCIAERRHQPGDSTFVLARVTDADGRPLQGVSWSAAADTAEAGAPEAWKPLRLRGTSRVDGTVSICTSGLAAGQKLRVVFDQRPLESTVTTLRVDGRVSVVPVRMQRRP